MTERKKTRAGKKARKALLGLAALVLCAVFLLFYYSSKPDGKYFYPYSGSAYLLVENGHVHLLIEESKYYWGEYSKSGDRWIITDGQSGKQSILKPTLLGIEIIDESKHDINRFAPRRGFAWLFSCWDWLVDHY
jgi:hypothetical protein